MRRFRQVPLATTLFPFFLACNLCLLFSALPSAMAFMIQGARIGSMDFDTKICRLHGILQHVDAKIHRHYTNYLSSALDFQHVRTWDWFPAFTRRSICKKHLKTTRRSQKPQEPTEAVQGSSQPKARNQKPEVNRGRETEPLHVNATFQQCHPWQCKPPRCRGRKRPPASPLPLWAAGRIDN